MTRSAKTKLTFKSDLAQSIHASAQALHRVGAINKATMRSFDLSCVATPADIKPEDIKAIREAAKVSQPIFASYLNTSASTVRQWESGAKQPSGMGLRLLSIIRKHGIAVLA
jgi:putative transcriptional regulator